MNCAEDWQTSGIIASKGEAAGRIKEGKCYLDWETTEANWGKECNFGEVGKANNSNQVCSWAWEENWKVWVHFTNREIQRISMKLILRLA